MLAVSYSVYIYNKETNYLYTKLSITMYIDYCVNYKNYLLRNLPKLIEELAEIHQGKLYASINQLICK